MDRCLAQVQRRQAGPRCLHVLAAGRCERHWIIASPWTHRLSGLQRQWRHASQANPDSSSDPRLAILAPTSSPPLPSERVGQPGGRRNVHPMTRLARQCGRDRQSVYNTRHHAGRHARQSSACERACPGRAAHPRGRSWRWRCRCAWGPGGGCRCPGPCGTAAQPAPASSGTAAAPPAHPRQSLVKQAVHASADTVADVLIWMRRHAICLCWEAMST